LVVIHTPAVGSAGTGKGLPLGDAAGTAKVLHSAFDFITMPSVTRSDADVADRALS
jgi:hypothetical protein